MPASKKPRALTPKEERFVTEYTMPPEMGGWNGAEAVLRAGYDTSREQARRIAWDLLRKPHIAARVKVKRDELTAVAQERMALSSKETLKALTELAYFDARNLVHLDGTPKGLHEMDRATAAHVAGYEVEETLDKAGNVVGLKTKVRLINRVAALEMAAKVTGEFAKDNEQRRSARDMSDEDILLRLQQISDRAAARVLGVENEPPPAGATLQ